MDMTERHQGTLAALTVMAARCERHITRHDEAVARSGWSSDAAQRHAAAVWLLRDVAEAIRVEAMLPPDAMPDVLRADYQPPSAKMDAAKVTR